MEKYLNVNLTPQERAADLLSKLSLEEKMGQVNCLFPRRDNWEELAQQAKYGIGQVSTLNIRKLKSLDEAAAWQRKIQKMVMENSRLYRILSAFRPESPGGLPGTLSWKNRWGKL